MARVEENLGRNSVLERDALIKNTTKPKTSEISLSFSFQVRHL